MLRNAEGIRLLVVYQLIGCSMTQFRVIVSWHAVQHALSVAKSVGCLHWLPDIAYDVMLHTAVYCSIFTVITSADLANYMHKPPLTCSLPPPPPPPLSVMFVGGSPWGIAESAVCPMCVVVNVEALHLCGWHTRCCSVLLRWDLYLVCRKFVIVSADIHTMVAVSTSSFIHSLYIHTLLYLACRHLYVHMYVYLYSSPFPACC